MPPCQDVSVTSRLKLAKYDTKALILTLAGGGGCPPKSRRQNTAARSKDRRGYSEFPAGLVGDRQKAARQPSGKPPSMRMPAPNGAGGVEGVRRVQLHPSRFSVSAWQALKILVGPCCGGPCSAHAIGMGTAGAPRGPTTPLTAILFLAATTARNRMAVMGVGIPMAAQQAAPPWRIPQGSGKPAVPLRSECPWEHRQPVGGAPAVVGPGGFYHQGQNDPLSPDSLGVSLIIHNLLTVLQFYNRKLSQIHKQNVSSCTTGDYFYAQEE
ncbi:hypothetical protein NDU88_003005 [Pleurodeles waltl]|uniref:Uncharacterized protein n=1 Tax=Pleurodeles waltl TaxID=8319 RepID=A0AAV7WRJ3_PLEWA|nr:hypothetical protein NDU88_003005 [Pleurodeles waltl]